KVSKNLLIVAGILLILIGITVFNLLSNYFQFLRRAHSTFENYYAFRGCMQLIKRTDTYGLCKIGDGETIKIVKFNEKWYLQNDLPLCINNFCF
ncbi:MAG TPA: hypothetical protein VF820_00095, partial [Patescibacteria group bacterium]